MRKFLLLLTIIISSLSAAAFYYNGLYFYPGYNGECQLRGYDPNYKVPEKTDLIIPSYAYDDNHNAYKVTEISQGAFKGRTEINNLVVPSTVERIYAEAFSSCINLKECILYPTTKVIGDRAFYGCLSLVALNTCAEQIGVEAFRGCILLSAVNLGAPMNYIASGAFMGCTALTNIDIPFTVEQLGNSVLNNKGVFEDCLALAAVTFSYNLSNKKPNIKKIQDNTFKNCINLPRLDFPYSLTYIGPDAFLRCASLKHIEWGGPETLEIAVCDFTGVPISRIVSHGNIKVQNSYSFKKLVNLKEVRFDTYATEIQERLFSDNKSLTTVHIDKVETINSQAFDGCSGLKYLTLSPELQKIDYFAFRDCNSLEKVSIPDNVTYIGQEAFKGCKNLKDLSLGNKVSDIRSNAFYGCYALKEIVFPMSLTQIYQNVVDSCINLKSVTIGGKNTLRIDNFAYNAAPVEHITFRGNVTGWLSHLKTLQSVAFTDYSTTVPTKLFQKCTGLKDVMLNNVKTIESYAFNDCIALNKIDLSKVEEIATAAFYNCTSLESADLSSIKAIGYAAFNYCTNLKSVKFGDKITEIPDCLSYTGITTLTIPDNVTSFSTAPGNCENLTSVHIGDGVTEIRGGFYNCISLDNIWLGRNVSDFRVHLSENLQRITSANPIPPQTDNSTFPTKVYNNATLIVPIGASPAYKNANYWKKFYNIKEADLTGIDDILSDTGDTEIKIVNGSVEIESASPILIYTFDGMLRRQLPAGNHSVNLPSGAYIIQSGTTTKKIIL